jgi:hypothetical protein
MSKHSDRHSPEGTLKKVRRVPQSAENAGPQGQGQISDDQQWRFEASLLNGELRQIEAIERAALTELGYRDAVHVFDTLQNATSLTRRERRAYHAMLVLSLIDRVRAHVDAKNAPMAAYYSLRVGAHAQGVLIRTMDGARREKGRSKGGKARVSQQRRRWDQWQTIADGLPKRKESRLWAAIQVQKKLDSLQVRPLPKIETIRKRIAYPKLKLVSS